MSRIKSFILIFHQFECEQFNDEFLEKISVNGSQKGRLVKMVNGIMKIYVGKNGNT